MARLEFHPEAARAIDVRGDALLSKVGKLSPRPERPSFASQRVPHAIFTEADIAGRITLQSIDEFKREVTAIHFEGLDGEVGLEGEASRELDKVSQLAHKYLSAKTAVSERFLRDRVMDWVQQKYRKEIDDNLASFLLAKVIEAVALRTILIPIANLCLEADLPFGPVDFKVLSAELVTSWYESYRSRCEPEDIADFERWFDRLRKDTQGLAAVSLTIEADEDYALEQCLEKAEQAVALLRIIHPANTSPHTALYVRPLGSENIESYYAYRYEEGGFQGQKAQARWPFPSFWEIPRDVLDQGVIRNLVSLFAAEERTDFQRRLFEALLIYSRNNIAKEPSEKLIFCLVAIETMLLKNPSEPIQDNIAERMAYLLGDSSRERLEIETLVKRIYEIRSRFVHHGQRLTDMVTLAAFMEKVWVLFFHFILNMTTVETKDEMIEILRRRKYQ
jgi:hypothetical protein